jgi:hypothetical protein
MVENLCRARGAPGAPSAPEPVADASLVIPLLFPCSAERFHCSADLIPLLGRVAELKRKPLI